VGSLTTDDYSLTTKDVTPPPTTATDDFNRADGALGSNWSVVSPESVSPVISGHQLTAAPGVSTYAFYTGITYGNNQFAQVTTASGLGVVNLMVRASNYAVANHANGYIGQTFDTGWRILRLDDGVETVVNAGGSYTRNDGDVFYLEAKGSTITFKRNGTVLGTITDTTYTSGVAGMIFYVGKTTPLMLDDWQSGTVG
jgi:hypothetical protein